MIKEVVTNNQGLGETRFKKSQAVEALQDLFVYFVALIGLSACGVINGGISNSASSLIKGRFTGIQATALQMPLGAVELVVVSSWYCCSHCRKNMRCIVLFVICIPSLAGLIGLHVIPLTHRWVLVGCSFLQFIIGVQLSCKLDSLNANVSGF